MNRKVFMVLALAGTVALGACGGRATNKVPSNTPGVSSNTPVASSNASGASSNASGASCQVLRADLEWYGDNRARLNEMIARVGECGGSGNVAEGAPVALLDWDNTVVRNDVGDAQTYWMLNNGKVLQPNNRDWTTMSTWLTDDAARALSAACDALAEPGQPLPTNTTAGRACADEIVSIYDEGETIGDATAFKGFNARRIEPRYAFAAQLLSGYTADEIKTFAKQARRQNIAAAEDTDQLVGSTEVTGWVRYYEQIVDLIDVLRANGFDVRIISASAQPVAQAWGEEIGIAPEKVMGVITMPDADGKLTPKLAGCGTDAESITYLEGKRCRVNEEVFGIDSSKAFAVADMDHRAAFGAGDSDTDVAFMLDATELRLAINRNKTELMCYAYHNEDGKWLINPMFIDPEDKKDEPYPCSTKGRILPNDEKGPLTESDGDVIADQEDRVFGD